VPMPELKTPDRGPAPAARPLPEAPYAAAMRSVAVPDPAPPYDDEPAARPVHRPARTARAASSARAATSARAGSAPASRAQPGPAPDHVAGNWPSQFAQLLAETLAGSRPADQLATWTTEHARQRIIQLSPLLAAAQRPRVRRVIVTSPAGGVLEMTVIVSIGPRTRAVAVRLEQASQPAHWMCTAVEAA
jgi:Family of unknown function (DUF6459)